MMFAVIQSINLNLIMSIFTVKVPLWISKRVVDFFLWKANGEECLFDLLESIMIRTQDKMLQMEEHELFIYLMEH
jgi:hypothetical protein